MPEGPSILILKEAVQPFEGKKILHASGNTKTIDVEGLQHKIIKQFRTWGKQFLICFNDRTIRIHLLMFGSYRINERKETAPRLSLQFTNGELNFYNCSVKLLSEDPDTIYDWSADVLNPAWDPAKAKSKLRQKKDIMVCDVLLDQQVFSGSGNIIKNEVLYRIRVHPETLVSALPAKKVNELVKETVAYSFDFLKWKKEFTLRAHWLAHTKTTCTRCNSRIVKKYTGKTNRRSFFCPNCQVLYPLPVHT